MQIVQVQELLVGREGAAGLWRAGRGVGWGGLVEVGMGGFCPVGLCWVFWGVVLDSDLISIGALWLPNGFSLLGGL